MSYLPMVIWHRLYKTKRKLIIGLSPCPSRQARTVYPTPAEHSSARAILASSLVQLVWPAPEDCRCVNRLMFPRIVDCGFSDILYIRFGFEYINDIGVCSEVLYSSLRQSVKPSPQGLMQLTVLWVHNRLACSQNFQLDSDGRSWCTAIHVDVELNKDGSPRSLIGSR